MASISANGSRGHHSFTLNVWENGTNQANNTSNVGWSLVLNPIQAGWDWNISGIYWSVSVNGVGYSGTIQSYDGRSSVTVASSSLDVAHDSDGNKAIGFSFSINDTRNLSYTPGSCSASGSMWLTHIDRWAIVTGANDFNDEQDPTMTFTNPAGYTMNVWLELNPIGEHLCIRNNIPNTGSYTWELTAEERQQLRQACTSNSCTIRYGIYTTISGSQYPSYVDKTFTIVNGNPVFEDFDYEDTNTTITNVTGDDQVLVKGLSTLQATISTTNKMVAVKEATEKNYVATIDTINQSENYDDENDVVFNLGTVNTAGTQRLNIRAYDSRNNSTLVYKDITVYDYAKPVINFTAERLNNFEDQTTMKISGSFSSLIINNVEKNTIQSVQYRYKEKDSQTWGNWVSVQFTLNNNEFNCNDVIVALDNTKEFDIEVKAVDNLSDNNSVVSIDVGKSIFFISSNEKECYVNDKRVLTTDDLSAYDDFVYEEIIIGTFFGKPLYRQIIDVSLSGGTSVQSFQVPNSDVFDIITRIDGVIRITSPNGWIPVNFYNSQYVFTFFNISTSPKRIEIKNDWGSNRAIIIIEYTKTTD